MAKTIEDFEDCDFFSVLPEGVVKHRGYYYANENSKTGYSVVEPCGCEIPMEAFKKNEGKERGVLNNALEDAKQCIGEITTEQMINWLSGVTPVRAENISLLIPGEYVLINKKHLY